MLGWPSHREGRDGLFLILQAIPSLACNLHLLNRVIYLRMHTGPEDMDLIARVLNGDHQAYSLLVARYQNFVFTITLRYMKSREDAEEVAQDVFVKA